MLLICNIHCLPFGNVSYCLFLVGGRVESFVVHRPVIWRMKRRMEHVSQELLSNVLACRYAVASRLLPMVSSWSSQLIVGIPSSVVSQSLLLRHRREHSVGLSDDHWWFPEFLTWLSFPRYWRGGLNILSSLTQLKWSWYLDQFILSCVELSISRKPLVIGYRELAPTISVGMIWVHDLDTWDRSLKLSAWSNFSSYSLFVFVIHLLL